jgi:dihydrofolate synthase / folylpolyglutamate synthase
MEIAQSSSAIDSPVEPLVKVDALLDRFAHFGVELGLERIDRLLAALGNPQQQVQILHVAGSNGKGSVCAYLSSVLLEAGYRVGRYTSPHLVSWCERISLNGQDIAADELAALLEVVLGGRLDATNVCDRPLVSIITSLSREHWQKLGSTIAQIAFEKAGILKPGCPAVIAPQPAEAEAVLQKRLAELNCPAVWVKPSLDLGNGWAQAETGLSYPLPLLGAHQLINSGLAIATLQILQTQGWQISDRQIQEGMAKTRWAGRMQWFRWRVGNASPPENRQILIDGAHNPAGAMALRSFVDSNQAQPIHWVMGMIANKDHADVFQALLRPGDSLYLVPVPEHLPVSLPELAALAQAACPTLKRCQTYPDVIAGLEAAADCSEECPDSAIVLCGSLYLIGHFFKLTGDLGSRSGT